FGIIYMARYIEARREEHQDVATAIATAHRESYGGTLATACAAMVAYGSLSATDFLGFRPFGVIGGTGMMLCWISTYLVLPVLLVLSESAKPMFSREANWRSKLRGVYGYPFAWLSHRAPGAISVLAVVSSVVSTALGVHYFRHDPMEYDLSHIRNDQL